MESTVYRADGINEFNEEEYWKAHKEVVTKLLEKAKEYA